jgi:hypothetical protein
MSQIKEIKVTTILEVCPAKYIHSVFLRDGTKENYCIYDPEVFNRFPHPEDVSLMKEYNKRCIADEQRRRDEVNAWYNQK